MIDEKLIPRPVEEDVHRAVWDAANMTTRLERAVGEARDLCYYLVRSKERLGLPEEVLYMANRWLDTFGRSLYVEQRIIEDEKIGR